LGNSEDIGTGVYQMAFCAVKKKLATFFQMINDTYNRKEAMRGA
jgi:hypothetical protein